MLIIFDNNQHRAKAFSSIAQTVCPENTVIYLRTQNDDAEWIWEKYPKNNNSDDNPIPLGTAKLLLIHYRDEDQKNLDIKSGVEVVEIWYGGEGRELAQGKKRNNLHQDIFYELPHRKAVNDVVTKERFEELWKWANDDNRHNLPLPFLLRPPTPEYLISLSILCQGYLATYKDSRLPNFASLEQKLIDKVSTSYNQQTVNNINEWWLKVLNQNLNWQEDIKKELKNFAHNNQQEKIIIEEFILILSEAKTTLTKDLVYQVYASIIAILDELRLA